MAWKKYGRKSYKKKGGWPMYVRHKRTGWKATLFGITDKAAMRKDLAARGFEVISHWEYYGYKRR